MAQAIMVRALGGPDVLKLEGITLQPPGPGEVQIRQAAIGLNFIDVYFRTGLYKSAEGLPFIPGKEGAGTITAIGDNVSRFAVGDRVAYASADGAYASERNIDANQLVKVPDGISLEMAGAMMLKGMTAQYLLNQTFQVGPETTLLFHAAAGGVGLIAGQWAKALGATVIGTAGSQEKIDLALAHGYDHVINYRTENFVEPGARRSPTARVSMWSMISSARTPFRRRSTASSPAVSGSASASLPGLWTPSASAFSPRKVRSLQHARPSSAMSPPAGARGMCKFAI